MSRWFRHYAGMMRDDKLVRVAMKSKQSIERVLWVWGAILESAAEIDDDGRYDIDADEMAFFIRCKTPAVQSILDSMIALDRIDGERVSSWDKRQFKGDSSGDRVKRYRENRKKAGLLAQWQPSKELRARVYARDNNQCVYCESTDDLTIDHKTPEMHGGTHDEENLHTACRRCNAQKRDLTHDEYVTRNAVTVTVTGHRQRTETEVTLAKANGVVSLFPEQPRSAPNPDSDSEFWSSAKSYLADETKNPGALIGKWSRDNTKQVTAQAITRAQLERPVQKIPFIEGCFRQMKQVAQRQPAVPL